jgi:SET domain-containing protein
MLLVPTKLGLSQIHGIGLFAQEPIRKDTVVWRFDPVIDTLISAEGLSGLAAPAREQIESYVYLDNRTGEHILCGDDARFFNHSVDPNVIDDGLDPYRCVAARDIDTGEELTQDYFSFDLLAHNKLFASWGRWRVSEADSDVGLRPQ